MRKYLPPGLVVFCCLLLSACYTAPPEKYFDIAVLNSNLLVGFANEGMLRQLESPSVTMAEGTGKPVAMKRSEIIREKIKLVEDNFKKLKGLKETGDTRDMLQTSLALFQYVLPVYKIEYTQLATLYDKGASKKLIQSQAQAIHDKYYNGYDELYSRLINVGKSYAAEHTIKVNW